MAPKNKIVKVIKLQVPAGKATPAPPIGPALGAAGVNLMDFCKQFNDRTKHRMGDILRVEIFVDAKRGFTFTVKEPPVSSLILKSLEIESGSAVPQRDKVGKITKKQILEIVKQKGGELRARSEEAACRIVEGTARSMGVDVVVE